MKRIVLAVAVLAGMAGCGPDCQRFCKHWVGDCGGPAYLNIQNPDIGLCIQSCDEVGGDYSAFIGCAVDKTCDELKAGHCQIPSLPPGIAP